MATLLKPTRARKFPEVVREIKQQIEEGELRPGDRLPSFSEMRARFDLAQNTVNRVFLSLEQDGLIVREQGRGIFVAAKPERKGVGAIGLEAHGELQSHPYYTQLLKGIQSAAQQANFEVLLLHKGSRIGWEKVDGMLLGQYAKLDELPPKMPFVSFLFPARKGSCVVADDYAGARQATEYLMALGHRRIAFLTLAVNSNSDASSKRRYQAYQDALLAGGIELNSQWVRSLRSATEPLQTYIQLGREKMRQWLAQGWSKTGCTAILAQNDETAIGIIEALQEVGIHVPEHVSVLGFDGTEIAEYFRPRLTTVQVPLHEIGYKATELLIKKIEGQMTAAKPPSRDSETIVLSTVLKVKDSTARPMNGIAKKPR